MLDKILCDIPRRLNVWNYMSRMRKVYAERAAGSASRMSYMDQAVDILDEYIENGSRLLDAGCGAGALYRYIYEAGLKCDYFGIDITYDFVMDGRNALADTGLSPDRLSVNAIENIDEPFDIIVCLNTLDKMPDFRLPLDRMATCAGKILLLRLNAGDTEMISYHPYSDGYLDEGAPSIGVYFNRWGMEDLREVLDNCGFDVKFIEDDYHKGMPHEIAGELYIWRWLLAIRRSCS